MALHLDDDDATLAAALALIDEWEFESVASEAVCAAPSREDYTDDETQSSIATGTDSDDPTIRTPHQSLAAPAAASRRRKLRAPEAPSSLQPQRRDELVFLRRTVRELEAQLALTQNEKDNDSVPQQQHSSHAIDAALVWKQIASRQHQHRHKAEVENVRLRVKLQEHVAIAKQLMRVLVRAYQDAGHSDPQLATPAKRIRHTRGGLAVISEKDQLDRIEELRIESDAIFHAAPFTGGPPVFRDVQVLEHGNGEATINVDSSWVLPYPVDHVTSAFWTYLIRKTERRECGFDNCTEETRDVLVTPYESNEAATRLVGTFKGRFVARRIVPDDQSPGLMVWDMRAEPVDFKPMSMDGVRIHNETTMRVIWADQVLGDAPSSPKDAAGRMALVQMSQRVHIQFAAAETPTRRRRVGALTNYLLYTVESELDWKQEMLETLLLRRVPPSAPVETWSA